MSARAPGEKHGVVDWVPEGRVLIPCAQRTPSRGELGPRVGGQAVAPQVT